MYLHIFDEFIARDRLPPVPLVVSDPLVPRGDKEKRVIETNLKLFYSPGANVEPLVNDLVERGFVCVDPAPYTLLTLKKPRYRRELIETIAPEQFLARRADLVTADLEFRNGHFELYRKVADGFETVHTKHYYGDRMIFEFRG